MAAAFKNSRRVVLDHVGIFADGVAVKQAGKETYRVARQCVDQIITVTTDEMCAAIKDVFDDTRSIAEPAGALAVAGLKKYVAQKNISGKRVDTEITIRFLTEEPLLLFELSSPSKVWFEFTFKLLLTTGIKALRAIINTKDKVIALFTRMSGAGSEMRYVRVT